MGRKSKNAQNNNTMVKAVQQRVRQPPRVRISGSISNSTTLRGVEVCNSLQASGLNTDAYLVIPLIGGSNQNMNTKTPLMDVAKLYSSFLFQPGTKMHYIPTVGLNEKGTVSVCFVNNSELSDYCLNSGRTTTEIRDVVLGASNTVTHAVWQEFTYAMNLPARRKRFDTNRAGALSTESTLDRTCQGVFIFYASGITAGLTVSTPRRESVILLEGLTTSVQ